MIIVRFLAVALATATSATSIATSINRPGGFISVDNMATNADFIALVEVNAGELRINRVPAVLYKVSMKTAIVGEVTPNACLEGPKGLRVGFRYLVFIQSSNTQRAEGVDCVLVGTIGDVVPRAMEIVIAPSGEEFTRLDNEKIVYPQFNGTLPVSQEVSETGRDSTLIIGSWAPLQSVLGYVAATRKRSEED